MKKILLIVFAALFFAAFLVSCRSEPIAYTVNFDTDGGEKIASITVNDGEVVAEPDEPEKEYSIFLGWYLDDNEYDFSTPVTSNITLTAKWEREEYRVKFDTAGGNLIDRVKVYGGDSVERPEDPIKENFVFLGWYIGNEEYDFSTPISEDITITAKWKIVEFTIKFNTDGGTSIETQSVEFSGVVTEPEAPIKEGYVFRGWYLGNEKYDFTTPVKGDISIVAKWQYIVPDDTKVYNKKQSVLLIGQSNMVGAGYIGTVEAITDDRITMLRDDVWVKMEEPIHARGGIGLAASFAKAFVETFDCELGLIPAALSGSNLNPNGNTPWESTWAVGSPLYEEAIRLARIAQTDSEICAILWHQGEGDQGNERYAAMLKPIFDGIIKELGLDPDKIIIITGELYGTRSDKVHGPQLEILGKHYKNYGIAQSDGLTTIDPQTHFDGPSMRVFGYRYFNIFYNIVTAKNYVFVDDPKHYLKQ